MTGTSDRHAPVQEGREVRPLSELREHGLLWLINRAVFHPRGYALGLEVDPAGNVIGWTMYGDGTEVWRYGEDVPEDELFAAAETFLASLAGPGTPSA